MLLTLCNRDSWDLGQLSAPAKAMTTLSRMAWSTRQASQDAQEGIGKATDALSSMASMDDDSSIEFNPNDPTRVSCRQGMRLQHSQVRPLLKPWF